MTIVFKVKYYNYIVGTSDFLNSFFSTITYRLENGERGSVYPILAGEFFEEGVIAAEHVQDAVKELSDVKKKLRKFKPNQVVWDIDDLKKQPPWGSNISKDITDLSNYFVTSDGKDLIEVLTEALEKAEKNAVDISISRL